MCLIVFAWHAHPDYPLVLAGNRDEFYARRTRPAAWWGQAVSLLAGQDEEAGGTWFGITRRGRLAALTNVRAPTERNPHAPSRGALVLAALQTPEPVDRWLQRHAHRTPVFNGFNLLAGDIMPGGAGRRARCTTTAIASRIRCVRSRRGSTGFRTPSSTRRGRR